jgi:hypothetical protein
MTDNTKYILRAPYITLIFSFVGLFCEMNLEKKTELISEEYYINRY